jgi:hypothetical protein
MAKRFGAENVGQHEAGVLERAVGTGQHEVAASAQRR